MNGITGEVRLPPGTYNYSFQCMLPAGLPTSVVGEFGYIRYTTSVVIDTPLLADQTFEQPFTVIKAVNLNADPSLRVLFSSENKKKKSQIFSF